MAILNSPEPLRKLIPSPKDKFYMSRIAHVPSKTIEENPIFAIGVDESLKMVTSLFRVSFALFSSDTTHYLFIGNVTKELSSETPYIKVELCEGTVPELEDWSFKTDDIGLYVVSDTIIKKKFYFVTCPTDAREIREKLKGIPTPSTIKRDKPKITLVTETVYV